VWFLMVIKILLGPVLLLQGRQVRRTALRLPEAVGERHGLVSFSGCERPLRLLFVGESTMAGVGVRDQRDALAYLTSVEVSRLMARSGVMRS